MAGNFHARRLPLGGMQGNPCDQGRAPMEIPPGRIARLAAKRPGRQSEKRHLAQDFPGGCLKFFGVLPQLRKLRQDSQTTFPALCQDRGVSDKQSQSLLNPLESEAGGPRTLSGKGEHA